MLTQDRALKNAPDLIMYYEGTIEKVAWLNTVIIRHCPLGQAPSPLVG